MNSIRKTLRALAITAIPAALALAATPALATPQPPNGTDIGGCVDTLTNPNADACAGYYTGNILNGSPADILNQQNAIASLPGTFTWDGNWGGVGGLSALGDVITSLSGPNSDRLDFGQTLFGQVIIGAHYGNVPGPQGNVSVFWLFNLTTPTNFITLTDTHGWSNSALYTTGQSHDDHPSVPEPATWAMMLFGFGAIGVSMRRSRRKTQLLSQLA
jgi:hypothetical protein